MEQDQEREKNFLMDSSFTFSLCDKRSRHVQLEVIQKFRTVFIHNGWAQNIISTKKSKIPKVSIVLHLFINASDFCRGLMKIRNSISISTNIVGMMFSKMLHD